MISGHATVQIAIEAGRICATSLLKSHLIKKKYLIM